MAENKGNSQEMKSTLRVDAETEDADRKLGKLGTTVKDTGEKAAQAAAQTDGAMKKVADSAEKATRSTESAARSMVASIQRAIAQLNSGAGTSTTSGFLTELSNLRNIKSDNLERWIAKLREAEKSAQATADAVKRMAELDAQNVSARVAGDKDAGDARAINAKADAAAKLNKASEYVRWWTDALEKAEAVEKRLADDKAFEKKLAEAAQLNKASEYVRWWTQALEQADAAERRNAQQKKVGDEFATSMERQIAALQRHATVAGMNAQQLLDFEIAEKRAAAAASGLGAAAQEQITQLQRLKQAQLEANEAAKGTEFIQALQQRLDMGTKSTYELLAQKAAMLGVSDQAGPLLKQLAEAEKGFTGMGKAARLSAQQLALVGPQLTDVIVMLEMGANPLTILLQQGGQLVDIYGGVGAALKGVGGFLATLLTPVNLMVGAVAGLAAAFAVGQSQSAEFARTITLTGNAAGVTEGQYNLMARSIADATHTTIGSTRQTLLTLISSGQLTGQTLQAAGTAAQLFSKVTGEGADAVAKRFAAAAESPAKFATELNKQYNILTAAQLQQIRALEDQGRTQEALTKTFDALNTRLQDASKYFGTLERWWDTLKRKGSDGIDFVLRIGRAETPEEEIQRLTGEINKARQPFDANRWGGNAEARSKLPANEARLKQLQGEAEAGQKAAQAAADRVKAENLVTAAIDEQNKYKNKQQQLDKALFDYASKIGAALENPNVSEAQKKSLKDNYQRNIDEIRDKFKETAKSTTSAVNSENRAQVEVVRQAEQIKLEIIKQTQDEATAMRQMGRMSESASIEEQTRLELQAMQVRRDSLLQQADIVRKKEHSEGEARSLERQAQVLEEQMTTRRLKGEKELQVVREKLLQLGRDNAAQQYADHLKEETDAATKAADARREYLNALYEQRDAMEDEQKLLELEASMLGRSDAERRAAVETLKVQLQLEKDLWNLRHSDTYSATAEQQLQDNATKKVALAQQRAYVDEWQKTADQVGQALTNALMDGGKSAWEYIKGLFRSEILAPVIKAVVQPVLGNIAGAVLGGGDNGGSGAAGGGSSPLGSMVNVASTLRSMGSMPWMSNFGGSVEAMGFQAIGNGWTKAGEFLVNNASTISNIGSSLGYLNSVMQISKGNWGAGIGSAVGTWFFGPVGGMIGNAFGGLLDGLFGGNSGTPHRGGGAYYSDALDTRLTDGTNVGFRIGRGDVDATVQKAALQMATSMAEMLNSVARVGGGGRFGVGTGFADDSSSDGAWGGLVITRNGQKLLDWNDTRNSRWAPREFANGEEGQKQYEAELARSMRDVLNQIGLPQWATDVLQQLGDSPSMDTIAAAVNEINALVQASKNLGAALGVSQEQFIAMAREMGGADSFSSIANSYIDAIYSDAEKVGIAQSTLAKAFNELGVALPAGRDQYRQLVQAQDLNTDAGRRMYEQLLLLAPVFGQVQDAAAQAAQEQEQKAKAIQQERLGIEQQILQLEGNKTELRRRELEALDPSNRALQQYLYTLQDAADAAQKAAQVESERKGLEGTLLQLQGNTTELRRRELEALDPANRAIQQLIYSLQDQQAATEKAAAVAEQRRGLEAQILELQGNTAELRARELAALDPANRALQQQIWMLQDAAKAAEEAKKLREAWKSVGETIAEEIKRIRGLGASQDNSFAYLQSQFAIATGQARAGDQDAAKRLPELSKALLDAAANSAGTAQELARIQAATAASLEQTMRLLQHLGVEVPAFAAGGAFGGGMRLVGENGPELEVTGPSHIFNAQQTARLLAGGGLEAEVRALRAENAQLRQDMRTAMALVIDNTGRAARVLDEASQGVVPLTTTDAPA